MRRVILYLYCGLAGVCLAGSPLSHGQNESVRPVDYNRDIQPIFLRRCYACHTNPNARGQLRLDSKTAALKGGVSGKAIIPGDSKSSLLVQRLLGLAGVPRMPMGEAPLSGRQIELIRAWIDQGAPWPDDSLPGGAITKHWAYVKPSRPELPAVRNSRWVRNPIDNFILARLEKEGLAPAPEASKEMLIRRVSLDLIGLPPSLNEIDDFLADNSPNAYEKVVDRLLASPHYGERWARPWLDLARYADTNGFEKDRRRTMWKYRDWVIDALNKDMPFTQFTIEQLAGDMLPEPTLEQKIATGFHRNAMSNEEGGVDQEEARWVAIIDRVNTTATVWLGTTLACAQCHNHKYDPFTQKEYYQLFAFFDNTDYHFEGDATVSEQKLIEGKLELPTAEQETQKKEMDAEIARLEQSLKTSTPELEAAQSQWERGVVAAGAHWSALGLLEFSSSGGATLVKLPDGSALASGVNPDKETYSVVAKTSLKGITALRLEALPDERLQRGGPGRDPDGNFFVTGFEVEAAPADRPEQTERVIFSTAMADDAVRGGSYDIKNLIRSSKLPFQGWAVDASKDAVRLPRQAVFVLEKPLGFEQGTIFKVKIKHELDTQPRAIGRFRLSVTAASNPTDVVNISATLRPLLDVDAGSRTKEQRQALNEYYHLIAPPLKQTRERIAELRRSIEKLGILSTLVMEERPLAERPSTHLRIRGSFTNRGERVYAGVPAALHPFPESQLPTRLGLARWLVDDNNPLVARVTVNRFWEQMFGRGIVETSEDFGIQGQRPTHPELLDWLATEFMRQGWSMKAIHRLIVTSATYRQSSRVTPALLERDPDNKLLARGPRFRVEAEMIRDVALGHEPALESKDGRAKRLPPTTRGRVEEPL